jgi:hypothetical protein
MKRMHTQCMYAYHFNRNRRSGHGARRAVQSTPARRLTAKLTMAAQAPNPAKMFCTSSLSSMAARKASTSSSASALRLAGSTGFLGL